MASFKFLTLLIVCTTLQEGCGLPVSEPPAEAPHPHRVRTKRCSCNSWEDKECIYFCHLDIIWVNTPSKLLPYGLGSPLSRRRRSADRCECHSPADQTCHGFCSKSSDDRRTGVANTLVANTNTDKLLASFRSVVKANMAAAKRRPSLKMLDSNKPKTRSRR